MNPTEKISLLKNVEFFSPLKESILHKIINECGEVSLQPDEILFREGEAADSMYLILSGLVAVFNENKTIALRTPGQYFGEMALIESKPRTASVKAVEPSILIELNKDKFENYLVQEPKILRYMIQTISSRYRNDLAAFERESTNLKKQENISQRLTNIIDESSNELYVFDDKDFDFVNVNNCACKNLGYTEGELNFMTLMDLSPDLTLNKLKELMKPLVKDERTIETFETELKRKDGSLYPVMIKLQYWASEKPPVFVAIAQDITESKRAKGVIKKITNYDPVTGLPNQTLLRTLMKNALNGADRRKERLGVLSLHVDNLKNLRGSLGDLAGDKLLQALSRRIQSALRKGDVVSRVSRDELVLFLPHLRYFEDAGKIAQKLIEELQQPFSFSGMSIYLEVKIGIAVFPDHGITEEILLKNSAIALDQIESGINRFKFYSTTMTDKAMKRLTDENHLRRALQEEEFCLFYQPKVDLQTEKITGMEALLRWKHPEKGMICPVDLIHIAEENRLIFPLGEWVIRTACKQIKTWRSEGLTNVCIAVNISAQQFAQKNLVNIVEQNIKEAGIPPESLELEITESALMNDMDLVVQTMKELDTLGVSLAIDDFGTGYSSLNYLKNLPIKKLKIDKSFLREFSKGRNPAIIKAIIALGHSLDLIIIAEGVETDEQKDFLRTLNCHERQGYLFSKPLPPREMTQLLSQHFMGDK